jgi:heme O synthase-like polyprenyltransferase
MCKNVTLTVLSEYIVLTILLLLVNVINLLLGLIHKLNFIIYIYTNREKRHTIHEIWYYL